MREVAPFSSLAKLSHQSHKEEERRGTRVAKIFLSWYYELEMETYVKVWCARKVEPPRMARCWWWSSAIGSGNLVILRVVLFSAGKCDCRGIKFALYYLLLRQNSIFCTERLLFAVERVEMVCYYERAIAAHLHREAAHISLADSWHFASAKKKRGCC